MMDYSDFAPPIVESLCFADSLIHDALHAFTLNPDPRRYRSFHTNYQYLSLLKCIFCKRDIMNTFDYFLFTPELTLQGNVHIHGYFHVKDIKKYYAWFLPACKHWGFVLIKEHVNQEWTMNYITKKMNEMWNLFDEELPVPLTSDNFNYWKEKIDKINTEPKHTMVLKFKKKKSVLHYFK